MTDLTLTRPWTPVATTALPAALDRLARRGKVLSRRARRNRYLALVGRSPRRYPWFEALFTSMNGH
jgi:hypothetical protein